MAIGDSYRLIQKTPYEAFVAGVIGTTDLHSHIRLRPVLKFLRTHLGSCAQELSVLEIGCGNGVNAFELSKIAERCRKRVRYEGVDFNSKAIELAQSVSASLRLTDFAFHVDEAGAFVKRELSRGKRLEPDLVLLIDVIEHIVDPVELLTAVDGLLRRGGIYAVSVPTPLYPRVFGRRMHEEVGHMVDGYTLERLDEIFVGHLRSDRILHRYSTGFISNLGCYLFYRLRGQNRYLNFLLFLALYPFHFLDLWNNSRISCSLFAVYRKP